MTHDDGAYVKLQAIVRSLKERDCPYLGNYKLGYDAALDDLLSELDRLRDSYESGAYE